MLPGDRRLEFHDNGSLGQFVTEEPSRNVHRLSGSSQRFGRLVARAKHCLVSLNQAVAVSLPQQPQQIKILGKVFREEGLPSVVLAVKPLACRNLYFEELSYRMAVRALADAVVVSVRPFSTLRAVSG